MTTIDDSAAPPPPPGNTPPPGDVPPPPPGSWPPPGGWPPTGGWPPSGGSGYGPGSVPPSGWRALRRSPNDRVVAGVSGGLGEYFGIDPVLFRVLFAVTSFFGGVGVLAYLLAWAAIPDRGAPSAPIDRFVGELRRRHVPFWLAAGLALLVAWLGLFSWWAPWPSVPVLIAAVVLIAVLARRRPPSTSAVGGVAPPGYVGSGFGPPGSAEPDPGEAVFTPPAPDPSAQFQTAPFQTAPFQTAPFTSEAFGSDPYPGAAPATPWMPEARAWIAESRERSRRRRRRSAPIRWSVLGVLLATMAGLAIADAIGGIAIPVYLWTAGAIIVLGLLIGLVLRRTPWTLALLLVPVVIGLVALGGTRASLHDGVGQRVWVPASPSQLHSEYRLAFGQTVLDLSDMGPLDHARTVDITMAAGQVRIIAPSTLKLTLHADVRIGVVTINGRTNNDGSASGVNVQRDIFPLPAATGPPLTINVHLADGNVDLVRH